LSSTLQEINFSKIYITLNYRKNQPWNISYVYYLEKNKQRFSRFYPCFLCREQGVHYGGTAPLPFERGGNRGTGALT